MDVAIIGLGLIGGSLLRALAADGHRVVGFDADPAVRELAGAAGYPVANTLRDAAKTAQVAVLAVPLPALPAVLGGLAVPGGMATPGNSAENSGRTRNDQLVTDVTSVKGPVRDLAHKHGLRRFVGGHPMAGTQDSGFAAGDPHLFAGCAWVLCLEPDTDLAAWLTLAALFTAVGARVVPVTAVEHDRAVAQVSHLPHLLAAALARQLAGNPLAGLLAAGSFRDGTRVAATRAELTAAMCGGNAAEVEQALAAVLGDLHHLHDLLEAPDPIAALRPPLAAASELRRAWPPQPAAGVTKMPADAPSLLALGRSGGWVTAVADNHATVTIVRPASA